MSTKKQEVQEVIENAKETAQEQVDSVKAEVTTIFGKMDRKITDARKAKADKKAAKAEAKAAKKAEKEETSKEKKSNLKVILPVGAAVIGATLGVVVKGALDHKVCDQDEIPFESEEAAPAEEPAEEAPEA